MADVNMYERHWRENGRHSWGVLDEAIGGKTGVSCTLLGDSEVLFDRENPGLARASSRWI